MIGGRAASRAERQAVDAVRRREERRQGITPIPPLPDERRRGSRGRVIALVAVVVVALVLLSIWSFQQPGPQESRAATPTTSSSPATSAPGTGAPATTAAPTAEPTPAGPVFAPVTVLNATDVDGLAGAIGTALTAGGWEVLEPGRYSSADVATTTVFFTAGDAVQEQAAETLQAQFPEIAGGPSERFFDVPGVADPGIVIIATGNWQP